MYELKIAGTDQVSFGPVPILMVVKIIYYGGAGTPIFSYIHMAWTIFGDFKNQYFEGVSEKWLYLSV